MPVHPALSQACQMATACANSVDATIAALERIASRIPQWVGPVEELRSMQQLLLQIGCAATAPQSPEPTTPEPTAPEPTAPEPTTPVPPPPPPPRYMV